MFKLYLSASTQEKNITADGQTEEFYMQKMVREIVPDLEQLCEVCANRPEWTLRRVIDDSNLWGADFHLALHTNAMPEKKQGKARGPEFWIHRGSSGGAQMAEILASNLTPILGPVRQGKNKQAYKETGIDGGHLAEVDDTQAPACIVELIFHDNRSDLDLLKQNWDRVKAALVKSVKEYTEVSL
jgi:N-acetylmuramoyl-L-alanine amidase